MKLRRLVLFLFVAVVAYSAQVAFRLKQHAEVIAGADKFCMQVAGRDRYEPVSGFGDMLGLKMRGHGAYHHAVLVIQRPGRSSSYHWSYWKNSWVLGANHPFAVYCSPSRHYLDDPSDGIEKAGMESFALEGTRFVIPRGYHPNPWPESGVGLRFLATAPAFSPAGRSCAKHLCDVVTVLQVGTSAELKLPPSTPSDESAAMDQGVLHGLNIRKIREEPSGSAPSYAYYGYYARDSDGRITTIISCPESHKVQCGHVFDRDGMRYRFTHMPGDLKNWRAMQDRLESLYHSFLAPPDGVEAR